MSDSRAQLGARLRALRDQSGAGGASSTIASALARAGMARASGAQHAATRIDDDALASRLGGQVVCPGVIRVRERLTADAAHGLFALTDCGLREALALVAGCACGPSTRWVFMDTETTGLSGGTGTLVFLLGMARFVPDGLEVEQLLVTGFGAEAAMLEQARVLLTGAEVLVTFNGRSFDAPLLATRFRLSGTADPFARLQHVDLLHPTRRLFAKRWSDCRLQTVERRLLGVRRIDDLPGREAPQAWFDWLRHGRDAGLAAVARHNRLDLLSLAVLPAALKASHDDPVSAEADVLACARARSRASEAGEVDSLSFLCEHRGYLDTAGLLELARLARRHRQWPLAVDIWKQLAATGVTAAIEHLAKYYEHQEKDYRRACELAGVLIACAPDERRHRRRAERLNARLAGPGPAG